MKIFDIKLRIGNIHESITVPCTARQITEEFLPGLKEIMPETSQISQEQNMPLKSDIEPLFRKQFPFMYIKFSAINGTTNIKIQHNKDRKCAQVMIILTGFM